jgi:hypothetical protein
MNRKMVQDMLVVLQRLLEALVHDARPAPPPTPPARPEADHQAYITADSSLCCARHDREFEASVRRARPTILVPLEDLLRPPPLSPSPTGDVAWYLQERLGGHRL